MYQKGDKKHNKNTDRHQSRNDFRGKKRKEGRSEENLIKTGKKYLIEGNGEERERKRKRGRGREGEEKTIVMCESDANRTASVNKEPLLNCGSWCDPSLLRLLTSPFDKLSRRVEQHAAEVACIPHRTVRKARSTADDASRRGCVCVLNTMHTSHKPRAARCLPSTLHKHKRQGMSE